MTHWSRLLSRSALAAALALAAGAAGALAEEFVAVTTRVVYPGETITAAIVQEVPLVRGNRNLGPIYQKALQLDGMVARRTILPGRIIPEGSVRPAYVVESGKPVQVIYNDGGLTISATAVPLEPGAAGDTVRLRNTESGRIFSGIVMADGTIRVGAS
jgi:flagella basal body P-ring formation protein FlgA